MSEREKKKKCKRRNGEGQLKEVRRGHFDLEQFGGGAHTNPSGVSGVDPESGSVVSGQCGPRIETSPVGTLRVNRSTDRYVLMYSIA